MKRFFLLTLAAGTIIFGTSCLGDNDTNPQQGAFLIANISPNSPPLNVYINSSPFGQGLSYSLYTPYYLQTAGSYTFSFSDSANNTALTNTVSIEANKYYSYFVIDSFSRLKSAFIRDSFLIPAADSVYVRFFNFSPNSTPLTLRDSAAGVDVSSSRAFNDQAFNPSYTYYNRIKSGTYTFQLKDVLGNIVASRKDTLVGGHVYSLFAKGFPTGTGDQAIGIGHVQNF